MGRWKKPLTALTLIALSIGVSAGFFSAIGNFFQLVGRTIVRGIVWMVEGIVTLAIGAFSFLVDPLYTIMQLLVTAEDLQPDVLAAVPMALTEAVMTIMVPILEAAIILVGFRLIYTAMNPGERSQAKTQVIKMALALILIPMSPYIVDILIGLNNIIVQSLLSTGMLSVMGIDHGMGEFASLIAGQMELQYCLLHVLNWMLTILAIFTLIGRYVLVIVFTALMPLTLFLYLFDYTRAVGRKFMKWTLGWIFAPVFMSLWILISLAMAQSIGDGLNPSVGFWFLAAFNIMIVASPLMMTGILDFFGDVVTTVGQLMPSVGGVALVAAGETMKGKGADAVLMAGMKQMANFQGGMDARKFAKKFTGQGGSGRGGGAASGALSGAQAGIKGMQAGTSGIGGMLKGMGGALKAAGAGLDATIVGAVVGVALQGAGMSLEAAGTAIDTTGKVVGRVGMALTKAAKPMAKMADRAIGKTMAVGKSLGRLAVKAGKLPGIKQGIGAGKFAAKWGGKANRLAKKSGATALAQKSASQAAQAAKGGEDNTEEQPEGAGAGQTDMLRKGMQSAASQSRGHTGAGASLMRKGRVAARVRRFGARHFKSGSAGNKLTRGLSKRQHKAYKGTRGVKASSDQSRKSQEQAAKTQAQRDSGTPSQSGGGQESTPSGDKKPQGTPQGQASGDSKGRGGDASSTPKEQQPQTFKEGFQQGQQSYMAGMGQGYGHALNAAGVAAAAVVGFGMGGTAGAGLAVGVAGAVVAQKALKKSHPRADGKGVDWRKVGKSAGQKIGGGVDAAKSKSPSAKAVRNNAILLGGAAAVGAGIAVASGAGAAGVGAAAVGAAGVALADKYTIKGASAGFKKLKADGFKKTASSVKSAAARGLDKAKGKGVLDTAGTASKTALKLGTLGAGLAIAGPAAGPLLAAYGMTRAYKAMDKAGMGRGVAQVFKDYTKVALATAAIGGAAGLAGVSIPGLGAMGALYLAGKTTGVGRGMKEGFSSHLNARPNGAMMGFIRGFGRESAREMGSSWAQAAGGGAKTAYIAGKAAGVGLDLAGKAAKFSIAGAPMIAADLTATGGLGTGFRAVRGTAGALKKGGMHAGSLYQYGQVKAGNLQAVDDGRGGTRLEKTDKAVRAGKENAARKWGKVGEKNWGNMSQDQKNDYVKKHESYKSNPYSRAAEKAYDKRYGKGEFRKMSADDQDRWRNQFINSPMAKNAKAMKQAVGGTSRKKAQTDERAVSDTGQSMWQQGVGSSLYDMQQGKEAGVVAVNQGPGMSPTVDAGKRAPQTDSEAEKRQTDEERNYMLKQDMIGFGGGKKKKDSIGDMFEEIMEGEDARANQQGKQ